MKSPENLKQNCFVERIEIFLGGFTDEKSLIK